MDQRLFIREAAIAEMRRRDLLREAEATWQIRNAFADEPQPAPEPRRSRFGATFNTFIRVMSLASHQSMGLGPRGFRDGLL